MTHKGSIFRRILPALAGLLLTFTFPVKAEVVKGIPLMMNYHHSEYRAEGQNWSVVEDYRGFIYVANLSGVLEFDGVKWRLIELPGKLYATSLAIDNNGRIYVGSHSEFGYLEPDERGFLQYRSLMHLFPEAHKEFSYIWKIEYSNRGIFFSTYDNLYRYHNDTISAWDYGRFSNFYVINNNVWVYDFSPDIGLLHLENDTLKQFEDQNSLAGYYIADIFPYERKRLLVYSHLHGFLTINNLLCPYEGNFNPQPLAKQEAAQYIAQNQYVRGLKLSDGNFAFGTINGGLIIMDKKGEAVSILDESMGLQNETINFLYEDSNGVLWLALDNGISSANNQLQTSYWNGLRGVKGTPISIHSLGNYMYIGTWQGTYRMDMTTCLSALLAEGEGEFPPPFVHADNLVNIGWDITPMKNPQGETEMLLLATADGLHAAHIDGNIKAVSTGHYYTIVQSKQDPNILVAAGANGVTIFSYDFSERTFKIKLHKERFQGYDIYEITEDKDMNFWLSHRNQGITRLKLVAEHKDSEAGAPAAYQAEILTFGEEHGLHPKAQTLSFSLNGRVFFVSEYGILYYDPTRKDVSSQIVFHSANYLLNLLIRKYIAIRYIQVDDFKNLWVQTYNKNTRLKKMVKLRFNPETKQYALDNYSYSFLSGTTVNDIYFDYDMNMAWIATDVAIFSHNYSHNPTRSPFNCYLRELKVNNKYVNIAEEKWQKEQQTEVTAAPVTNNFHYRHNNFSFSFAIANFFNPSQTMYAYYLEGLENTWSAWSNQSEVQYSNLIPGNYTFHVKGLDAMGNQSNSYSLHFRINKPWYKTLTAFFFYLVILILLILLSSSIINKRLIKAKQLLEEKIAERTAEINEKQKLIEQEKHKADQLLQNILPVKIANELKLSGSVKVQYYDMVTIMFMDFKDFSKISQFINPMTLIYELNNSFCKFDEISQRNGLEKIKTIGDAYMCAGGIPDPNHTHPFDSILAAFEILNFVKMAEKDQWLCDIRIGIHTGEIMAGVIGKNKFAYDIWGESVNTASRMEAAGEPGKINISGETYELVKDFFVCEYRGKLEAKHHNEFDMYFVRRIKKEYSKNERGTLPNNLFWQDVNKYLSKVAL